MFESLNITSGNIVSIVIGIVIAILVVVFFQMGYLKASPDEALIISGLRKNKKILIGRAGLRIPFFEKKDVLQLQLIPIDVKTSKAVPTADYINITVDAAVNVKIGTSSELIEMASINFLNKKTEYISSIAREVLEGNMREIVGRMKLEEMVSDRQKFATLVKENADPDLAGMGLEIISFNVQNFSDGDGVIDNLGVDNIVRISKSAAISRAESEKEIERAQSDARSQKDEAATKANLEIEQRQSDYRVKQAQLKVVAERERAIADAAYQIAEEEQRKNIELMRYAADIAAQQKARELKEAEAAVKEQELNATVRKKADADKYQRERMAEAALIEKEKEAEAALAVAKRDAEAAKAKADADLFAKQKEAEGIAAIGRAEAEAIKAKGEAEAAAMEKKAEAYRKYGDAAITEMIVGILPDMAREISAAVTTIDKVSIIDSGNGSGVGTVGSWAPGLLQKTIESVKDTTGFDLTEVMKASTYDAKVNRNVELNGIPGTAETSAVQGPRFEGDHDHVYDEDGKPVHG